MSCSTVDTSALNDSGGNGLGSIFGPGSGSTSGDLRLSPGLGLQLTSSPEVEGHKSMHNFSMQNLFDRFLDHISEKGICLTSDIDAAPAAVQHQENLGPSVDPSPPAAAVMNDVVQLNESSCKQGLPDDVDAETGDDQQDQEDIDVNSNCTMAIEIEAGEEA